MTINDNPTTEERICALCSTTPFETRNPDARIDPSLEHLPMLTYTVEHLAATFRVEVPSIMITDTPSMVEPFTHPVTEHPTLDIDHALLHAPPEVRDYALAHAMASLSLGQPSTVDCAAAALDDTDTVPVAVFAALSIIGVLTLASLTGLVPPVAATDVVALLILLVLLGGANAVARAIRGRRRATADKLAAEAGYPIPDDAEYWIQARPSIKHRRTRQARQEQGRTEHP